MAILFIVVSLFLAAGAEAQSLPSVIYVGAIDVDPKGRAPAELGVGVDLNAALAEETELSLFYLHGANPGILRAFRYGLHTWRAHAKFRHHNWRLAAGEIRTDRRLFGTPVVGDGVSIGREDGLVIGSLIATRPKHFTGSRGGHLVDAALGVKRQHFTVQGFASDLERMTPDIALVDSIELPEDDAEVTLEDLERLGALLPRSHRVRMAGLDSQVRLGRHTFTSKAAWIEQQNESSLRLSGPGFETQYAFADPRASVTASLRRTPQALPGVDVSGSLGSVSARIRLTRGLKAIMRAHEAELLPFGRTRETRTRGGSAGIEFGRRLVRMDLLANYRDARSGTLRRTRTVSSAFRVPIGRVTGEGRVEVGEAEEGRRLQGVALYRFGVHVDAEPHAFMVSASYQDYGALPPRLRADLSASTTWRGVMAEIGVGGGRSQLFGDDIGAWTTVEVPLPGALVFHLGVNYERWLYATSRYITFVPEPADLAGPWRLTATIRKELNLSGSR